MERGAKIVFQPCLETVIFTPDQPFIEGVDQGDQHDGSQHIGPEAYALGNAAGDDGRDGGGKGEQKEEMHQLVAVGDLANGQQLRNRSKEGDAIGNVETDQEVGDSREAEVGQHTHQRIDLILFSHRSCFQKSKACMHGQHHCRPHGEKKDINPFAVHTEFPQYKS